MNNQISGFKEEHLLMTKARVSLITDAPFWGALALRLKMFPDPTCKTAWTDGISLGYNPEYVNRENMNPEQRKGLVAHEVAHCVFKHHTRKGSRDHKRWNIAGDYAADPVLTKAGFEIPDATINPQWKDWHADKIYPLIPEQNDGGDGGDDGEGGEGGGGHGEVRPMPNPDGDGQASEAQMKANEMDWDIATTNAATAAKAAGNMPAFMEELIKDILTPKISWQDVLRKFITQQAKNDYRWSPPNRMFVHQNLYLPSMLSDELGEIALIVDTSGSTLGDRQQFAGEMNGILEEFDTKVHVVYVDAAVAGHEEWGQEDLPLKISMKGGGGTSFAPGFEFLEEKNIDPCCIVYLTDMECSQYPANEPAAPTLWISTTKNYSKPPFGMVVEMD